MLEGVWEKVHKIVDLTLPGYDVISVLINAARWFSWERQKGGGTLLQRREAYGH